MAEKKEDEKENSSSRTNNQPIPFLEWLMAAIGLILAAGALGFIIYNAATGEHKPPILKVKHGSVEKIETGYLITFDVENIGNETAAEVLIEGKLTKGAEEIETSSVTFDYVPSQSKRTGGLYFNSDPRQAVLEIAAKGYQKP